MKLLCERNALLDAVRSLTRGMLELEMALRDNNEAGREFTGCHEIAPRLEELHSKAQAIANEVALIVATTESV